MEYNFKKIWLFTTYIAVFAVFIIFMALLYKYGINDKEIIKQPILTQITDTITWSNCTSYQSEESQCDKEYWVTASGMRIVAEMYFREGQPMEQFGYCAVSRDLLNVNFNFYDTIQVIAYDKLDSIINKRRFVIIDCMNKRLINSVDILTDLPFSCKVKLVYNKK